MKLFFHKVLDQHRPNKNFLLAQFQITFEMLAKIKHYLQIQKLILIDKVKQNIKKKNSKRNFG